MAESETGISTSTSTSTDDTIETTLSNIDDEWLKLRKPTKAPNLNSLRKSFEERFHYLAKNSNDQFLPTPITNIPNGTEKGKFLAMDLGGTNLRVGVVELLGQVTDDDDDDDDDDDESSALDSEDSNTSLLNIQEAIISVPETEIVDKKNELKDSGKKKKKDKFKVHSGKSYEIPEELKKSDEYRFFDWIVEIVREVLGNFLQGLETMGNAGRIEKERIMKEGMGMGIAFSFPMVQQSHNYAIVGEMGKGFTFRITRDLSTCLLTAYSTHQSNNSNITLPPLQIIAISNDGISTLLSGCYAHDGKAKVGIIVGTGTNSTCFCPVEKLLKSKLPKSILTRIELGKEEEEEKQEEAPERVLVNTEWSIRGTLPAFETYCTKWDKQLDEENEKPGFQPFEEMIGGRYLGELVRLVSYDLLPKITNSRISNLPNRFHQPYAIETKFCSKIEEFDPRIDIQKISQLCQEYFSVCDNNGSGSSQWTDNHSLIFHRIANAISTRAAALVASATVGLFSVNDDDDLGIKKPNDIDTPDEEIVVVYTGTVLEKYSGFKERTSKFMDKILSMWYDEVEEQEQEQEVVVKSGLQQKVERKNVRLVNAEDGGLFGAAVLAGMVKEGTT